MANFCAAHQHSSGLFLKRRWQHPVVNGFFLKRTVKQIRGNIPVDPINCCILALDDIRFTEYQSAMAVVKHEMGNMTKRSSIDHRIIMAGGIDGLPDDQRLERAVGLVGEG